MLIVYHTISRTSHKSFSSSPQDQDSFWDHPGPERKTGISSEDVERTTGKENELMPRWRMGTKM